MYNLRQSFWAFYIQLAKCIEYFINFIITIPKTVSWFLKMITRILNDFLKKVGDETGVLALKLMSNRNLHVIERLFWIFTFITAIFGALFITNLQITRYIKSPTVLSVDRDYRDWEGFMPAVTLCYYDRIDWVKADKYIRATWNVSSLEDDYRYFIEFLNSVVNAGATNYGDLAKFAEDDRLYDVNLYEISKTINKPFEQIINTFEGNFEMSVKMVLTERGWCYVINSPMSEILDPSFSSQSFGHLKSPLKCKYAKQKCYIKIDLLENTGAIEVHSPFEISSADTSVIPLLKSNEIIASYKVLETVASSNLRDLGVEQRKCVFNDEKTSELKIYSKTLCLAKCRAKIALDICNCVPFFYTLIDGPSCNADDFRCLLHFNWPIWGLHKCKCPNTCTEIEYTLQTVQRSSWGIKNVDDTDNSDVIISSFRWELIPPKVRVRRDVVFSFEDLLVSFGGTLALFLGISILSVISFIYYLAECILQKIVFFINLIFKGCRYVKQIYMKRRKIKREIIVVKDVKIYDDVVRHY